MGIAGERGIRIQSDVDGTEGPKRAKEHPCGLFLFVFFGYKYEIVAELDTKDINVCGLTCLFVCTYVVVAGFGAVSRHVE